MSFSVHLHFCNDMSVILTCNSSNNMIQQEVRPPRARTPRLSFPARVYYVLKLCEDNGRPDIISWVNNGTAFIVNDLKEFERDLLPTYFNTKKYNSFTRTLCAYGFTGTRKGRQPGVYSHPAFKRDDPVTPSMMKRARKGNKSEVTEASNSSSESNTQTAALFPLLGEYVGKGLDGFHQTADSQISDRTASLLARLQSEENGYMKATSSPTPSTSTSNPYSSCLFHPAANERPGNMVPFAVSSNADRNDLEENKEMAALKAQLSVMLNHENLTRYGQQDYVHNEPLPAWLEPRRIQED